MPPVPLRSGPRLRDRRPWNSRNEGDDVGLSGDEGTSLNRVVMGGGEGRRGGEEETRGQEMLV
eukprot:768810-Hanusia_phi.AAC.7